MEVHHTSRINIKVKIIRACKTCCARNKKGKALEPSLHGLTRDGGSLDSCDRSYVHVSSHGLHLLVLMRDDLKEKATDL